MLNKKIKSIGVLTSIAWIISLIVTNTDAFALPSVQHLSSIENKNSRSGDRYWRSGKINKAIAVWQKEALIYRRRGRKEQEIEALLKVAQGYISLGKFRLAVIELGKVQALAPSDSKSIAITQRRLGNAYNGIGNNSKAIAFYKGSLKHEKALPTLNNLVNLLHQRSQDTTNKARLARQDKDAAKYRMEAKQDSSAALKYARQALTLSQTNHSTSSVRALIEWNSLSRQLDFQQLARGEAILSVLPPSEELGYLMLNWAEIDGTDKALWLQKTRLLAESINNSYLKAHAFLDSGNFARKQGDLESALKYAQLAQIEAQSVSDYNSLFRAQQLAGSIYRKTKTKTKAINAYRSAIASIDIVTQNTGSTNKRQITNLTEAIEPVYRETLELLLEDSQANSPYLKEALLIFDKIRLAQLSRYFGENCFKVRRSSPNPISLLNKNAAVISSITLKNKTYFILQLSDGQLLLSETKIPKAELVEQANKWNSRLTDRATFEFREGSEKFYDLIIKPFEAELTKSNTEAIVFIHDGILRNLPMAALYDGEEFLAQKWASVSSIGLNFTPTAKRKEEETKILAFGLQGNIPGWTPLYNVIHEIERIQNLVGGDKFLNSEFTLSNMYQQLGKEEYGTIHFATHGYFGGTAETSFILAHEREISVFELEGVLSRSKQIPNLLVLSACETALSSERSILGLGGVAARSGVRSTIGTLWPVLDDEQNEMITAFYRYWQNSQYNKATALQKLQIEQIKIYAHPKKWAALTLIGDYR